jgi:o-succinylbenzoate synthase
VVPEVDGPLLDRVAAAPDRVTWWEQHLAAVRAVRKDRRP